MTSLKILGFFAIIIKQVNSMLLWLKHRRRQNLVRILETHSPIGSQPNSAQALSLLRFTLGEKPGYGWRVPTQNLSGKKINICSLSQSFFVGFKASSSRWKLPTFYQGSRIIPMKDATLFLPSPKYWNLYHRYDEVCSHNFYDQAYQDKSGHFSQLVWNATRELGVGKAMGTKFGMNCTFIVARYRPLGNIGSEFAHDVTKGNFDSSYCSNVQRDVLPHHGAGKSNNASRKYRYRTKIPRFPKIVIL